MRIETKYFGVVEIKEEDIIRFPQGIPGFLDEKDFVLLNFEESGLFQVLQSIHQQNPAFVVIDPFLFVKDYQFKLDDATINQLSIEKKEEVRALSIVTVREPLTTSTANLQAPVIINQSNKQAKQLVAMHSKYTTREAIFQQSSNTKEA
ncbi:flagellar assembly protein FliW [Gracilibacillus dipsosauri]|uniref:flagellar assembly protein FliW n=1 Tax=Gracilibacillus dipsosauri TaxID=178340 RepID=UPI0006D120EE